MPIYAVKAGESKVYVRKRLAVKSFKEVLEGGVQGGEPSFVWFGSFVPVPLIWWLFGVKGALISLALFVLFVGLILIRRKICSKGDTYAFKS